MPKGEETRHRIVAEAAALFNKNGFEGSSLSELMKATCSASVGNGESVRPLR
jgi:AcrR family transcriptional regulator